jgi:hypothetical protein
MFHELLNQLVAAAPGLIVNLILLAAGIYLHNKFDREVTEKEKDHHTHKGHHSHRIALRPNGAAVEGESDESDEDNPDSPVRSGHRVRDK